MTTTLAEETVSIDGRDVEVRFRRNPRARRLILRIDRTGGGLVVTVPPKVSLNMARLFLGKNLDWARRGLEKLPDAVPFADGVTIPFRGQAHLLVHAPSTAAGVQREDTRIVVSGEAQHFPRRVNDWLRAEAGREMSTLAHAMADKLESTVGRVTVRDTVSRWGSCSRSGNLSFSWRLILAPSWVASYVAAHEAAHLREPNHSDRFWALVRGIDPNTDAAEDWLRTEGPSLHRYGRR